MERDVSTPGAATATPVAATAAAARERAGFLRGQVIPQGFTYIDVFVESFEHRALGPKELSRLLATLRTLDQRTTSLQTLSSRSLLCAANFFALVKHPTWESSTLSSSMAEIEDEVNAALSAPDESTTATLERSIIEKQDLCRRYAAEKVHLAVQARQLLENSISTLENQLEQFEEELHHSGVEIPLEISIEARKRKASQKSSSGHHGAEKRWDRGKHTRHHYDLQTVEGKSSALPYTPRDSKAAPRHRQQKHDQISRGGNFGRSPGMARPVGSSKAFQSSKSANPMNTKGVQLAPKSQPIPRLQTGRTGEPLGLEDEFLDATIEPVVSEEELKGVGRQLRIKYDGQWYTVQVVHYDPKKNAHTIYYPDHNQEETLVLGTDVPEDEFVWVD